MSEMDQLLDQARTLAGRYVAELDGRAVMPSEAALARLAELRRPLPDGPTHASHVLAELDRIGSPATVATTGGRFFGFVVGGALPVTVAANWLASAWDQNAGTWILAPGAAELEVAAAEWLLDIFDLPATRQWGSSPDQRWARSPRWLPRDRHCCAAPVGT
jgi:glutamate/tyrosine decarboxylase-like PLP-dependent enzyme